jgi:hypothetical protein
MSRASGSHDQLAQRMPYSAPAFLLALVVLSALFVFVDDRAARADDELIQPPTSVPEWVFRADARPPSEIVQEWGFNPWGDASNTNLIDHLTGSSGESNAFVSASAKEEFAAEWAAEQGDAGGWVYKIAPGSDVYSVPSSVRHSLDTNRAFWSDVDVEDIINGVLLQDEWASNGSIYINDVHSAQHVRLDDNGDIVDGESWDNPRFERPNPGPTTDPFPIQEASQCVGDRRAACVRYPKADDLDEDALGDLNRESFHGDIDDVKFSLDKDVAIRDDESMLAPLPESLEVSGEFADLGHSPEGFGTYAEDMAAAFRSDTEALAAVTSHAGVIDSVSKSLGSAVDVGSELVPYVGIAATGYALREDIDNGRWGDAAADAVAEGLQMAMVAAPEFDVFLEPALIVVAVGQMIADAIWGWTHPKPAVSEEQRNQIYAANTTFDESLEVTTDLFDKELRLIMADLTREHLDRSVAPAARVRMAADEEVLRASSAATRFEIFTKAEIAQMRTSNEGLRKSIRQDRDEAFTALAAATRAATQQRFHQYVERADDVVATALDAVWTSQLTDSIKDPFVYETVMPYIEQVTENMFRAFSGNPSELVWSLVSPQYRAERDELAAGVKTSFNRHEWSRRPTHAVDPSATRDLESTYLLGLGTPGDPVVSRARWTEKGIEITGTATWTSELKTTDDEAAGWFTIESGAVQAGDGNDFRLWTHRRVDEQAVVKAFGPKGEFRSNYVAPSPTVTEARGSDDGGSVRVCGWAEPGSELKTTNDPRAGWYEVESGPVRADTSGAFCLTTTRMIKSAAAVKSFGRHSAESNHLYVAN